ncbi:MAG: hypothetical protein ACR2K6_02985 [Solirubrobacterales bacterium]
MREHQCAPRLNPRRATRAPSICERIAALDEEELGILQLSAARAVGVAANPKATGAMEILADISLAARSELRRRQGRAGRLS